ncbi:hypothetical protein [Verrucomicrobium sp. BvORR106]|uniref:hypothetical protein n=1 Tax=Verrucomicrobium sp. BvORR106 TaxID=1403819 RepID=UPI00056ED4F7|nr:hypothetical protein [Verrucomicrobium sp. BvORR106]
MTPAPALVLYPENILRDVRHAQHRLTRLTHHRVLDHLRPVVHSAAAVTREALNGAGRPASWAVSNPLTAVSLALGAGVLVAATIRVRHQQTNG